MPKWLIVVLALVGLCCVGCVVGGGLLFQGASKETEEAKKYAESVIPQITKPWNVQTFLDNADQQIVSGSERAKTERAVKDMADLFGDMKSIQPWTVVGINAKSNTEEGSYVDVELNSSGEFAKHPAKSIELSLRKRKGGAWKILGLFLHEKEKS